MNLFEAKRIAERNGYKVIKESEDKTVPPWAKKKAMLKESKDETVPPWAKKKMMIEEAREIVERAGYTVIEEAGRPRTGLQGNGMNGSPLASLAEEWITGQPCKFELKYKVLGLEGAKAEFIDAVEAIQGHGVSNNWSASVQAELSRRKDLEGCLFYLAELMQGGQGRSRWGRGGRRWC